MDEYAGSYGGFLISRGFAYKDMKTDFNKLSASDRYKLYLKIYVKVRCSIRNDLIISACLLVIYIFATLGRYDQTTYPDGVNFFLMGICIFLVKLFVIDKPFEQYFEEKLRTSVLECPHCERVIHQNESWTCAHCKKTYNPDKTLV